MSFHEFWISEIRVSFISIQVRKTEISIWNHYLLYNKRISCLFLLFWTLGIVLFNKSLKMFSSFGVIFVNLAVFTNFFVVKRNSRFYYSKTVPTNWDERNFHTLLQLINEIKCAMWHVSTLLVLSKKCLSLLKKTSKAAHFSGFWSS